VIEPLVRDEDYLACVLEDRERRFNLAKAAGRATRRFTMRPARANRDDDVRNTTARARAFACIATALGRPSLFPFLKAVCRSKNIWQARHTGCKIVQQRARLMGCVILSPLKSLMERIEHGLMAEQQKVRTPTALARAALAEAATPSGIKSFDSVLKPLWKGIRTHRENGLAAFLKARGSLRPLMDADDATYYYTREARLRLIHDVHAPDEQRKTRVLKRTLPDGRNIVITVDRKKVFQFCTATDKQRDPLATTYSKGEAPVFVREQQSATNQMLHAALRCEGHAEAEKVIEDTNIGYFIKNRRTLGSYFTQYFAEKDASLYEMRDFKFPPLTFPREKTVVFIDPTGYGKTQYALAHFKHPLLVQDTEDWKRYKEGHTDGIVLDDIDFQSWSRKEYYTPWTATCRLRKM
ncbi:splicing factor 3B subunit 1-like, partial [Temnothorax americanus]|uniref:splicing factor 3B subunit 1-like n=1 Tax=Temnothorax americanus TaxID=1964332 RepID=UPI00406810EC